MSLDFEKLFTLTDNNDFAISLYEILDRNSGRNPEQLNSSQKTLFLCINIENAGQADSILSFLQEDYSNYSKEVISALSQIGAVKSSELIKQAVELLPKDGSWFYDSASEESQDKLEELDREFSDYPDGLLCDLYRMFAENHKEDFK